MGGAEVVVDLSGGSTVQLIGGLDLNHELFVNDHVEPLSNYLFTFVVDWNEHLSTYTTSARAQLSLQRCYIYLFKKPESKSIVHVIKSPNHGMR